MHTYSSFPQLYYMFIYSNQELQYHERHLPYMWIYVFYPYISSSASSIFAKNTPLPKVMTRAHVAPCTGFQASRNIAFLKRRRDFATIVAVMRVALYLLQFLRNTRM